MTIKKSFADRITQAPLMNDAQAAARFEEYFGPELLNLPAPVQLLMRTTASCSPYLSRLMVRRKASLLSILEAPPDAALDASIAAALAVGELTDEHEQMRALREAKADAALAIALADLGGVWEVMQTTDALSRFADACVGGALRSAIARSPFQSADGFVVLAMGKHGAFELNYSSDIDLIVLFDRERMKLDDPMEMQKHAVAVTRDMVNLLQKQTADGYVFRTDLRLRPDPGVSAAAVSVQSAERYYEAFGQNWERMAFIKARPCAGDIALGKDFLNTLRPFIWRKFLDYSTIDDVHAVKQQMHSANGGGDVAFEGHDVKLGRGGIREIEFYAQTQQLILGGKNPALRMRGTLPALEGLLAVGRIRQDDYTMLTEAYRYFRHVEHRLQMVGDEQTHRLPTDSAELEQVAAFAGEKTIEALRVRMLAAFHGVEQCYDALFEAGDEAPRQPGPLVFTGVGAHAATLKTLTGMGFARAEDVSAAIRRWHTGALRATRSERARTLLTKLVPPLLDALSKASEPDEAFFAFEDFLRGLPAGVQVFSLLLNNLTLFDTLIRIMTISPYLGREFSRRVNFVERLLDNRWSTPGKKSAAYMSECEATVVALDYEAALNVVRRWAGEQRFQITAQLAVGLIAHDAAARHFTAIANAAVTVLARAARKEMERQHGAIDGECVVVGLGRLGAGAMTATSDIDLMFIYDAPADAVSNGADASGARSLGAVDYFTRLVRRTIAALSAATEEGALYEVDMQLRPSGRAGPAAVSLSAFRRYYAEEAWTWEMMSLVKARVIDDGSVLAAAVTREVDTIFRRARARDDVARDVAEMRLRLCKAKPGAGPWDVKNIVGGQTDIAFIVQFLALISGARLGRPPRGVAEALEWFAEHGELAQEEAVILLEAQNMFEAVLQAGRAATGGVFKPEEAGEALSARMAAICLEDTVDAATRSLARREDEVARIFAAKVG